MVGVVGDLLDLTPPAAAASWSKTCQRKARRVARLPVEIRGTEDERKGTLLKRPKPMQDKRVDMPTIGPSTVSKAAEAGLKVVAAVEHSALWVEVEKLKSLADSLGVALVSLRENGDWP